MWQPDDSELLRRYAEDRSEEAFAALVTRHVNLVYSVALRQTGNPHNAEEIAQAVFVILAKKRLRLRHGKALSSWLFEATRLTAANFVRSEMRRHAREQEGHVQLIANEPDAGVWPKIAPMLDAAVAGLRDKDRQAIVLRFYEGRNLREVGEAMGASEEAAKKRVNRALERLRAYFGKRGAVAPVALLASAMAAHTVDAAPAALTIAATAAALSGGAAATASTVTIVKGALKVMAWTKAQTSAAVALIAGLAALTAMQHYAQVKLRDANEGLTAQMAQTQAENERLKQRQRETAAAQLAAVQIQAAAPPANAPAPGGGGTNLYARLYEALQKAPIKLTHEQAQAYLGANGTNASSLLAAFRTSGDDALLHEAMEKYPNDPHVAFEAAFETNLPPEERRQWLNTFEKSAPDNALANYLSALDYFKSSQTDQGLRELQAAAGKSFDDYTVGRAVDDDEAFLAAGYPAPDAKVLATSQLLLPQLGQMKQLGIDMVQVASDYSQAGDAVSAQSVLQMAADLGQRYSNPTAGEGEISQLVGIWIERDALQSMDSAAAYGESGQTVQDRLNELAQQNGSVRQLGAQASNLFPELSDQDWVIYKDRWLMFGEENAQQWVVDKYGQK